MEQITIRHFGPIQEAYIADLRPLTVLIGESGSGKSTILKTVALFRWIYKMMCIRSFLRYSGVQKSPFRLSLPHLLQDSGLAGYMGKDTELEYRNGAATLTWKPGSKRLAGTESDIPREELSLEKIVFVSDKRNVIADIEAGAISTRPSAFYLSETLRDFETAVRKVRQIDVLDLGVSFEARESAQRQQHTIVAGGKRISLNEASSGTQNVVPMSVIVEYFSHHYDLVASTNAALLSYVTRNDALDVFRPVASIGSFAAKRVHIAIEEPELSLFPSSQCTLMDFLTSAITGGVGREHDVSMMITTHSPYIVNYLNVLLRRSHHEDNTLPAISGRDIAAYRVFDGRLQNLVGHDTASGETLVNTMDLSEEMDSIYREYTVLGRTQP